MSSKYRREGHRGYHTDLIQLEEVELGAHLAQQGLGGLAVGAP